MRGVLRRLPGVFLHRCAAGFSSSAGAERCTKCPAGTAKPAGAGACAPCEKGSFAEAGSDVSVIQHVDDGTRNIHGHCGRDYRDQVLCGVTPSKP